MGAPAIRTDGLTKNFGGGDGLFDLDLEVEEAEVLGYPRPQRRGQEHHHPPPHGDDQAHAW
jgi:hypothetical protein